MYFIATVGVKTKITKRQEIKEIIIKYSPVTARGLLKNHVVRISFHLYNLVHAFTDRWQRQSVELESRIKFKF